MKKVTFERRQYDQAIVINTNPAYYQHFIDRATELTDEIEANRDEDHRAKDRFEAFIGETIYSEYLTSKLGIDNWKRPQGPNGEFRVPGTNADYGDFEYAEVEGEEPLIWDIKVSTKWQNLLVTPREDVDIDYYIAARITQTSNETFRLEVFGCCHANDVVELSNKDRNMQFWKHGKLKTAFLVEKHNLEKI